MAIIKDVTVKINNGTATLDAPVQFYEKDHDVELRFKLLDYKYKYDKDPQNILNSVDEDILEAYTTIVNPKGYELEQINGVVQNDIVIFRLDPTYTDELDELGMYKLQIHIKCTHSEFTIPPITFEVLERLKGIKVVTDGEDEVDNSEILDNSSKFVSDETGKLIIEWKKGDMISSAKLNAMVDVINDAVDEEVIRQANERERERKAANKIQELENTRVEYVNKIDTELDSFADQVDESMTDYETRFNALTVSQQQDAEVIDARDGEQTLRARLDRDIQKPSIMYEEVEGSHINVDTTCGYAKNVEILGNTIQNQNDLADIRSVGDKLENQELYEIPVLSVNKNLFNYENLLEKNYHSVINQDGTDVIKFSHGLKEFYRLDFKPNTQYTLSYDSKLDSSSAGGIFIDFVYTDGSKTSSKFMNNTEWKYYTVTSSIDKTIAYIQQFWSNTGITYLKNIQLEEGTVATPYEPYQEDKLTILSPVQLEKVGDVADRIICKDGVWGVEKNIGTIVLDGAMIRMSDVYNGFNLHVLTLNDMSTTLSGAKINLISDVGNVISYNDRFVDMKEGNMYTTLSSKKIYFITTKEVSIFNAELKDKNIKYILGTPTFIPLPHDQQVKLRTFANKTNISFGCEIEPTLKASIPKSIGATVSTHTEQIDNLGKELDKVKKLEESVASEVITESSFTTVTETSNGYFEDVKLEGKTLVNLVDKTKEHFNVGMLWTPILKTDKNKKVTVFVRVVNEDTTNMKVAIYRHGTNDVSLGAFIPYNKSYINNQFIVDFSTDSITDFSYYTIYIHNHNGVEYLPMEQDNIDIMVLEGDHTQNPPEFFEGLKSVGQDVDEISVLSANENLFNVDDVISEDPEFYKCNEYIKYKASGDETILKNDFAYNTVYTFKFKASSNRQDNTISMNFSCKYTDGTIDTFAIGNCKPDTIYTKTFTSAHGKTIEKLTNTYNASETITLYLDETSIIKGEQSKPYTPHKQNKKPILYYNDETQTWEKPVLRQWDSIEKHSDGKYYYHKRSGEVVLNGSKPFALNTQNDLTIRFSWRNVNIQNNSLVMCDKFNYSTDAQLGVESISVNRLSDLYIVINKSKLSPLDVAGFKAWLQANPTTVVYQLAEEKVYECTNLDLITYENETNFIVNTGAITPKSTLKVMCNITNVVRELQQKVSNLENYIQHVMIDALNNALNE